ncbi:MAG TPA: hypothetical protein VM509_11515, partial [Planctomycetota bacterium]|nr:hypothetical protein [Planctomycetota bacterium]
LAASVSRLRAALAPLGGRVRIFGAPESVAPVDHGSAGSTALALMQRIRERLDPDGVFASGRFLEAR